jgi:hypothetical protein
MKRAVPADHPQPRLARHARHARLARLVRLSL